LINGESTFFFAIDNLGCLIENTEVVKDSEDVDLSGNEVETFESSKKKLEFTHS